MSNDRSNSYLNPRQAAEWLGVSERYLYALLAAKVIAGKKFGKLRRISPKELERASAADLPSFQALQEMAKAMSGGAR
jgi:excisionase family DNA binding protein